MNTYSNRNSGSVIVVSVAMLLLLSLLAVTYVTVMQVEVQSNEAYQYGAKCDMVIMWYMNDVAGLLQSSVRNTGLYEHEDRRGNLRLYSVKEGYSRDKKGAYLDRSFNQPHPQTCRNFPHNYFMTPLMPWWKQMDYDTQPSSWFCREWGADLGWTSPGGEIFGRSDSDVDLMNWDGDNDPITHRQSFWRTYRNPDPGVPGEQIRDTWDNIYARAAGMGSSTQRMLYLGEYRSDWTDRTTRNYVRGHQRRVVRVVGSDKVDVLNRPVGYNLAAYKAGKYKSGSPNEFDHRNDLTHTGEERVDRSKLEPTPNVYGMDATSGGSPRNIGIIAWGDKVNILDDGDINPDSKPDITYWKGGEGNMNINALIRMLRHFVNTRAAYAIAKHRPYRTKEQIIQAIEMEGATLTTIEYHRLMNNVTCHANYDPITGVSALNLNKLRFPAGMKDYLFSGPDPLLTCVDHVAGGYDREITNYLIPAPSVRNRYNAYKIVHTGWCYANEWDMMGWEGSMGDYDPAVGAAYLDCSNGVLAESRMLWAAFSCIPSLVINHDKSDDLVTAMNPYGDPWLKMAAYARREYELARDRSYGGGGIGKIQNSIDFERDKLGSVLLRAVVSIFRNINNSNAHTAGIYGGESGMGEWAYGDVLIPAKHVSCYQYSSAGNAMQVGATLRNGQELRRMTDNVSELPHVHKNDQRYRNGWTPVSLGPQWEVRVTAGILAGPFLESIDRIEEITAWLAPFHPVCNPHGRTVITERQANDILNNFIDFRDNIRDPNNVMTDWKLHSQTYDRGNFEAYKYTERFPSKGVQKDGYINDDAGRDDERINTVCSMLNGFQLGRFPEVPEPGSSDTIPDYHAVKAKVPYIYIRQPRFEEKYYQDNVNVNADPVTDMPDIWETDKMNWKSPNHRLLTKGASVIEMDWNTGKRAGEYQGLGYGDPEIEKRLRNPADRPGGAIRNPFPWVNDVDHQDLNIVGIGLTSAEINSDKFLKKAGYMRNYNWTTLNWTKDWVAFNYHHNLHNPTEFTKYHYELAGTALAAPFNLSKLGQPGYDIKENEMMKKLYGANYSPVYYAYDEENYKAYDKTSATPADSDGVSTHCGIAKGKIYPRANCVNDPSVIPGDPLPNYYEYMYYESPGLIWGPDRINDAFESLDNGHILVDLSNFGTISDPQHPAESTSVKLFTDTNDFDNGGFYDYIPDNDKGENLQDATMPVLSDLKAFGTAYETDPAGFGFDRALNAFMWNCTRMSTGSDRGIYGGAFVDKGYGKYPSPGGLDFNIKVLTYFGYRGFDAAIQMYKHTGETPKTETAWLMGRFDFKTDSRYFHGTHTRSKESGRNGWGRSETGYWGHAHVVTMYDKPYLWDVPMKSPTRSTGMYNGKVTFGYSYNYGRNVYAYDFDGSATAIKDTDNRYTHDYPGEDLDHLDMDWFSPTMFKKVFYAATDPKAMISGKAQLRYVPERYGERGCVAGAGGIYTISGFPSTKSGYNVLNSSFQLQHKYQDISQWSGGTTPNDKTNETGAIRLIPRFNCVEPHFDPMYPNGRLFYRRLMTCGDTTIVIGTYGNGPDNSQNSGILVDNYNPVDFSTYTPNNVLQSVRNCRVRNENSSAVNPVTLDGAGGGAGGSTASWPCAGGNANSGGGGSHNANHWNHVYNARYSVPRMHTFNAPAESQRQYACADAPWSVPFTTRDRFYEITVRADIVDTSLLEDFDDWRGVELLSTKKAVAIFDRGWRWAYWDERINEACPWYDPYQMVGSRPGVDMAAEQGRGEIYFDYSEPLYDNEMYALLQGYSPADGFYLGGDWDPVKQCWDRDRIETNANINTTIPGRSEQVKVGFLAPAEYSGQNRPGDDCAERARFVFFKWLGNID